MTQGASDQIQSMRESIGCRLATQLGTYAKFTPKQKATTPTISSVTLANWPCRYLAI